MDSTTRIFRQLIVATIVWPLLAGLVTRALFAADAVDSAKIASSLGGMQVAVAVSALLLFSACIATKVGLYRFRRWARTANVLLLAASFPAILLFGAAGIADAGPVGLVETDAFFNALGYAMEGGLVAMSFLAPQIVARFTKQDEGRLVERLAGRPV
jgi:hypothetical protein